MDGPVVDKQAAESNSVPADDRVAAERKVLDAFPIGIRQSSTHRSTASG